MKKLTLTLFSFFITHFLWAQLNVYVNATSKDSVISTPFAVLNVINEDGKSLISDKVVGIRNVHRKTRKYWLFFYFLPTDVAKGQSITIKKGNFAYFVTDQGTYLRIPYNGKTFTYKYPEMAGFFIDVSDYIAQLKNTRLTFVRLETSNLYHEINLDDTTKISALLKSLE